MSVLSLLAFFFFFGYVSSAGALLLRCLGLLIITSLRFSNVREYALSSNDDLPVLVACMRW